MNLVVNFETIRVYSFGLFLQTGELISPTSGSTSGFRIPTNTFFEPIVIGRGFIGYIRGIVVWDELRDLGVQYLSDEDLADRQSFFGLDLSKDNYLANTRFSTVGYGEPDGFMEGATDDKDIVFDSVWFR